MNGFEDHKRILNKGGKVILHAWGTIPEGEKNITHTQGPDGFWYRVSPFGSREPWRRFSPPPALPDGFVELFGPRPLAHQFRGERYGFQIAMAQWQNNLATYEGLSLPADLDVEQWDRSAANAEHYGYGEPVCFENNYGHQVGFPDSVWSDVRVTLEEFLLSEAWITNHQWRRTNDGEIIPVDEIHAKAPPTLQHAQFELRRAAKAARRS